MRLTDANPIVPSKALEQLNSLLQHAIPGVIARISEAHFLAHAPLLEENSRRVFVAKKGSNGLFEGSAKEHGSAGIFLLPTIEIAVPVTARAAEVGADLRIRVIHYEASSRSGRVGLETELVESSSHWLAGAKPSRLISEMPLIMAWLIFTPPRTTPT